MSVRDSLTATLPRLRRPVALALTSLLGMLTLGVFLPVSAYATGPLSAPDSFGAYQVCNINVFHDSANDHSPSGSGAHWKIFYNCNWGGTKGGASPWSRVLINYGIQFRGVWGFTGNVQRDPTSTTNECSAYGFPQSETDQTASGCLELHTNDDAYADQVCVACSSFGNSDKTIDRQYWQSGPSCWGAPSGCGGVENGRVQTYGSAGAIPSQPADYYTGGLAPPTPDSVKGTGWPCSRTLDNTSTMVGSFATSDVTQNAAHVTVTQAVYAWGDGGSNTTITGAGPTFQANHTFPAIGSMPTNGWTTTVTVTYVAVSGHTFSDSSTSQTSACSVRVDFLHPDQSAPGSTDNGSTGDSSLDSCIPSGWGILNPINLIGGVGCLLKKLFIPTSATSDAMTSMWDGITSKAPFSVLYEVVTFVPQNLDDFVFAVNATSPVVSHGIGGPGTSPICAADNANTTHTQLGLCDYSGVYPFEGGGPFRVDGATGHVTDPNVYLVRQISLFALGLLFFYACYRGVGEILK